MKELIKRCIELFLRIYMRFQTGPVDMTEVKSICFLHFKPLGVGDFMMMGPTIRAVKERHPNVKITILTDKPAGFLSQLGVDIRRFDSILDMYNKVDEEFDVIVLPQKNLYQSMIATRMKKKHLIGHIFNWGDNHPLTHYCVITMDSVRELGVDSEDYHYVKLQVFPSDEEQVKKLIKNKITKKIIVINPFVTDPGRRWPKENFKDLIKILPYKVIIVGGPEDKEYNKEFKGNNVINLTGKLEWYELAALCRICDVFVTCDSGPMHVAMSEGCKMVTIWGVTNPITRLQGIGERSKICYPFDMLSIPLYKLEHHVKSDAIMKIKVLEVYNKIMECLK